MPLVPLFGVAAAVGAAAAVKWMTNRVRGEPLEALEALHALEAATSAATTQRNNFHRARHVPACLEARARLGVALDEWLEEDSVAALWFAADDAIAAGLHRARVAAASLLDVSSPVGEILLLGITGVGKSTLANAVLGYPAAATGTGAPLTKGVDRLRSPNGLVTVVDTEGLELGGAAHERRQHLLMLARLADVVWYCVQSGPGRFQRAEADLISALATNAPVLVVLTQSLEAPDGLIAALENCLQDITIVPILAESQVMATTTFASWGLDALYNAHRAAYIKNA